jgi:hypothetical protein
LLRLLKVRPPLTPQTQKQEPKAFTKEAGREIPPGDAFAETGDGMSEPSTTEQPLQAASIELRRVQWTNEAGVRMERVDSLHATQIAGEGTPRVRLHLGASYRRIPDEPTAPPVRKRHAAWKDY